MRLIYGKQDFCSLDRGQQTCFLVTNGLGGFCSQTIVGGASRNDHAALMACTRAPNNRWNLIHRLEESLTLAGRQQHLSAQRFADGPDEDGWHNLDSVVIDPLPVFTYTLGGVRVEKRLALDWEHNTLAVRYRLDNDADTEARLTVTPWLQFVPKGQDLDPEQAFAFDGQRVLAAGLCLHLRTNGRARGFDTRHATLCYDHDVCDGRRETGLTAACCMVEYAVAPGGQGTLDLVFTLDSEAPSAAVVLRQAARRLQALERGSGLHDPAARQLAVAADAFIARRDSTGGKTILAGYPFFEDWGRDTMIALPGCALATGRYDDAKSILLTFAAHERRGLMPNLFPEGGKPPMYNTVDAALLFINCVWLYYRATGDGDFVRRCWPVMQRIEEAYRTGTDYAVGMDPADGLIAAGQGLDQLTWMDVRIGDILPTPRHGKPVEINAYWYNALCILCRLAETVMAQDGSAYDALAGRVRTSFVQKFWREDAGCLRDVISGTAADEQIRPNQIWAVSMPFTMLDTRRQQGVVRAVRRHLYTPVGLRTLSPDDPAFHPVYGGAQRDRDLAYHQGTVWPFPLGGYYLACLRSEQFSAAARRRVKGELDAILPALREGCAGQLPEIYDGLTPTASRGCFAQAWSVGEVLRVYRALEDPASVFGD